MSNMNRTLEDMLGDFSPPEPPKNLQPITIWIPADDKTRYDNLQERTNRRFSKKAREVLIELIGLAEERIS